MDKREIVNRIEYVVACIGAFAQHFKLSNQQAYAYLKRYMGLQFLYDCYEAEHTLSIEDAVSDLQTICMRNGGRLCSYITGQTCKSRKSICQNVRKERISVKDFI